MKKVGLKLEQEVVLRRAAVGFQDLDRGSEVAAKQVEDLARLVGDRFEHRANELRAAGSAREPEEDAARRGVPVRGPEAGERGNEIHVAVAGDRAGESVGFFDRAQDSEAVAKPGDGGSGDESAPFERVAHSVPEIPRDGREEIFGPGPLAARLGHEEKPRSISRFRRAGLEASLAEERGLLISDGGADRNRRSEKRRLRNAEIPGRREDRGQHPPGDFEDVAEPRVPRARREIEQQGS